MGKNNEYLEISKQIVANIGGMDNIQGTAHCATRLRIVLKDNDLADIEKLEDIDKVKGAFIAGNQLQLQILLERYAYSEIGGTFILI